MTSKLVTQWNFTPLLRNAGKTAISAERKIIQRETEKFIQKWSRRRDYLRNPRSLKTALDDYENWTRHYAQGGAALYYFWLRLHQNENDPVIKAGYNQMLDFSNEIENRMRFFYLNLAKIPLRLQPAFLKSDLLKDYRHFLERAFAWGRHLLNDKEEKILLLKDSSAYANWVRMTSGLLGKEEKLVFTGKRKETRNFGEILGLLENQNKRTRDSAAGAFNEILVKHIDVAEAEINSVLGDKKVNDELRGMKRPDFSRHLEDDVESGMVDVLVRTIAQNFHISEKYYELKAKLLGVKALEYHERNVPYGKLDQRYPYSRAVNLVGTVFRKLDPDFYQIFRDFALNGQVDVYPRKSKAHIEFCIHWLIEHPSYILLNYNNQLGDVLTIAHEFGHAINNELVRESQNALNFGTTIATTEVASTFMEDFVIGELFKEAGDEEKLSLMMMKLDSDVSSIFRQAAAYRFELELHSAFREKGYLSKAEIGALFRKHMLFYMGRAVRQSPGSENWWVYWSHIRDFFYNYSYASGLLISKYLQAQVRQNPLFIHKVKEFMSAGLSAAPEDIFQKVGVDITKRGFWERGLKEIENLLHSTLTLAKKLGKIG